MARRSVTSDKKMVKWLLVSTQSSNNATASVTDLPYSTREPIFEDNLSTSSASVSTEQVTSSNPTLPLKTRSPCSPYPEATTVFDVTLP
uniref:Uncharacterized protein n=1 Tax=Panagrellus redivivus TaxID=6233 RepID=A0A7E4VBF6_PANRE